MVKACEFLIWSFLLILSSWTYPSFLFAQVNGNNQFFTQQESLVTNQWSPRIVSTRFGSVRGYIFTTPTKSFNFGSIENVEVFLGLPYASPPVGSLRFMPPVSGSPWQGTKMNILPSPVCPQVSPLTDDNETEALKEMPRGQLNYLKRLLPLLKNQSEDCLYLNIYVPISVSLGKTSGLLPVLVFLHGNDFGYGGGHPYNPSMLVSQGHLIVVNFNYRLGILGFLNANSDGYFKSPANFALLDQIAALHWVQENIGFFGGDRGNVTLMGHGKGAIFANFLMISSAVPTGLLFHRVILASGSALAPNAAGTFGITNGKELAKKFATNVKCPLEPPSEMLSCLRQIPLEDFLESKLWSFFGPSDDGVTIDENLKEPIIRERLSHYPLLFGVTKVEMLPSLPEHDVLFGIEPERRREILKTFIEKHFSVHRNEILAASIHEYTEWERPVQHPISVRDETLDALADAQIVAPLVKTGDIHSQSNQKSYFYVFEYQSKSSDFIQRLGCVHGEDLYYVFGVPIFFYGVELQGPSSSSTLTAIGPMGPNPLNGNNILSSSSSSSNAAGIDEDGGLHLESSSFGNSIKEIQFHLGGLFIGNFSRNEVQLSQIVMQFWTNFIKSGNPNEGISLVSSDSDSSSVTITKNSLKKLPEWPHYDPMYKKYLAIDTKPRVRTHYRAHKLSFWLHLVPDLMKNGYGILSGTHHNILSPGQGGSDSDQILGVNGTLSGTPPPPTIQLVGPPLWEHNTKGKHYFNGGASAAGSVTGTNAIGQDQENDGYQIYSTALSVTIAIGCSLLILNILIFAAFYYQRDKRRNENSTSTSTTYNDGGGTGTGYEDSTANAQYLHGGQIGTNTGSQVGTSGNGEWTTSHHHFVHHRRENGQIGNLQMPNICGDLPTGSNDHGTSGSVSEQQQLHQGFVHSHHDSQQITPLVSSTNFSNTRSLKRQTPTKVLAQQQQYEMTMPDAILAAAMMNMQQHQHQLASIDPTRTGRRSSLTFKEHLSANNTLANVSSTTISYDGTTRTNPRPPKRNTPSVKFNCEDNSCAGGDGSISSSASTSFDTSNIPSSSYKSQTLKPSLKKNSSYNANPSTTNTSTDELKV